MRKIKFRQYLDNGKWHYWGFVKIGWVGPMLFPSIEYAAKHSQQYTGLKDKNGKEIFEGDILHIQDGYDGDISIKAINLKVEFTDGEFYLCNGKGTFDYMSLLDAINNFGGVVIGNVHENPPTTGEKGEV